MKKIFTLLLLLPGQPGLYAQITPGIPVTYYVSGTRGNDANNGLSWASTFQTVQKALEKAVSYDTIWVAAGTYYPDEGGGQTDNRRESSFNLKAGVALYGGFAGTETKLSQRNWTNNITTLSGDLLKNDGAGFTNNGDNAYHVVRATGGVNATAVLDGFTIKGGNADGYYASEYDNGGGLYNYASSPTIAHCTFVQNFANYGGGVYTDNASSPSLTNCSFNQNTAGGYGGGLYNDNASSPTLTNCRLLDNKANQGGGIYNNHSSSPVVTNCSLLRNTAQADGGGLYNYNASSPTLVNCSFWSNTADRGGALYNFSASPTLINSSFWGNTAPSGGALAGQSAYPTLVNCILWGNSSAFFEVTGYSTVTYSLVQGGYAGEGNLDTDPLFRHAAAGDLRLQFTSPARNAGNDAAVPAYVTTDLDGHPRIQYGRVDMGAYEFQAGDPGSTVYVHPDGNDANEGATWATAFRTVQKALARASSSSQIWVAKGTYYPDEIDNTNSNSLSASFVLRSDVTLYGGFAGTETTAEERNWSIYETILSGDINQDGGFGGNSNNVIQGVSNTVLDGFTITGGSANSWYPDQGGGGMHNHGSPTVRNCIFTGNQAYGYYSYGGAVHNDGAWPTFINCLFWNNAASIGGAIFNLTCYSPPNIINCTFAYNGGGAIFNQQASPQITNCILWGNSGFQIANMPNFPSYPSVMSSIVQGGWNGTGNKDADPLFVKSAEGNLRLMPGSPAIDAGYNGAIAGIARDLSGHSRIVGSSVDMGAYEYASVEGEPPPDTTHPLTLVCPDNITLPGAADDCGAFIDFNAAQPASVDGGTLPVSITYSPASGNPLPIGEHTITVTATDSKGNTRTCTFTVTVVDETPPAVGCPAVVGLFALEGQPLIKATDPGACTYTVKGSELDAQATDNCPAPLTYAYSLSGATTTAGPVAANSLSGVVLHRGRTTLTWVVQDAAGNQSSCSVDVLVTDKTAPVITAVSATPSVLYPPNHKLQVVTVSYTATDNCAGVATTLSVTSNEPQYGSGSGDTGPDWQVIDNHTVQLRAERSGKGTGRIYTITITATDEAGNTSTAATTVTVPHDKAPVTAAGAGGGLRVTARPNPSSEGFTLQVQSPSTLPLTLKVLDAAGRIIEQRTGVAPNGVLYLGSTYRPGVYYVHVVQGSVLQSLKLVKQTH